MIGKPGFTWINARCRYIDIRTEAGLDICEYPDSDKINILDNQETYERNKRVDYYKGEENIKDKWQLNL